MTKHYIMKVSLTLTVRQFLLAYLRKILYGRICLVHLQHSATVSDHNILQRIERAAEKVITEPLSTLKDI